MISSLLGELQHKEDNNLVIAVGGVGLRRGRRDPDNLRVGDTVDCWRVETIEPGRRLRLQGFSVLRFKM